MLRGDLDVDAIEIVGINSAIILTFVAANEMISIRQIRARVTSQTSVFYLV